MASPADVAPALRLLLDEMHSPRVAAALIEQRFDAASVAGNATLRGSTDVQVLTHAAASERVVVTENLADFAVLVADWSAAGRSFPGVVFTSPRRFQRGAQSYPGNLIVALAEFLHQSPVTGSSWTWWL